MKFKERLKAWYDKLETFASRYLLRQEFYALLLFLLVGVVALLYRGGKSIWGPLFNTVGPGSAELDSIFIARSLKSDSLYFWKPTDSIPHDPGKLSIELHPSSISLNGASPAELEQLPGVGAVMSKRIVEYRRFRGKFRSLDELMNVAGIGQKKFERLKPYLRLD